MSVILEAWKMTFGKDATVLRLVGGIQAMEMQVTGGQAISGNCLCCCLFLGGSKQIISYYLCLNLFLGKAVVDAFYREFQIPRKVNIDKSEICSYQI